MLVLEIVRGPIVKAAPTFRRYEPGIFPPVKVPFADVAGPVAGLLEDSGHGGLCERKQRVVARDAGGARKSAGQDCRSRRATDRVARIRAAAIDAFEIGRAHV